MYIGSKETRNVQNKSIEVYHMFFVHRENMQDIAGSSLGTETSKK